MGRARVVLAICMVLLAGRAAGGPLLGRFAQPAATGVGVLSNFNHDVVVERGFKLNYLAHQRRGEMFGKPTLAGFVTLLLNGQTPAYTLVREQGAGTRPLLVRPTLGRYAKDYGGEWGRARLVCEDALGRPTVRFGAELQAPADRPLQADWLITGYQWDGQPAPRHWEWWSAAGRRVLPLDGRGRVAVPRGEGFLLAWNEGQPYTLALLPTARPQEVLVTRQAIVLRFAGGRVAAGRRGQVPDLYLAALEAHPADSLLSILPALARPGAELISSVRWVGKAPYLVLTWADGKERPLLPVPPPFSRLVASRYGQDTPLGRVAFLAGGRQAIRLPLAPHLEQLTVDFPPLPPEEQAAVAAEVEEILACQQPDGTFTFSQGRPFYDGQTAGVLIQLAPLLDELLRGRVQAAVRQVLDYWWGRLRFDPGGGIWHFPEPSGSPAVVDYPEITATVLYPTAAYTQLVDRGYARLRWPEIAKVASTIGRGYDVTGSAWAHAGPQYVHVLTESTVGGYLAYASLYHLARLAGQASAGYRGWACWAQAAMDLYRWRPEYGRGGILSQYFGDGLFVEPAVAWDYTMYTWFSWCPLWYLPPGDPYHVFEVLKQQRWWEYYHGSRQLAYDFCHFMALVRFGDPREGLAHWQEILEHAPSRDNFDTVALYRPLARCWREEVLSAR